MKTVIKLILVSVSCTISLGAEFQNMSFESPNVNALHGPSVNTADAIPNWGLDIGGESTPLIGYNSTCLTCPQASLYDSILPRLGKFTFGMTAGAIIDSSPPRIVSTSLFQTGEIPASAQALIFDASIVGTLNVSVGESRPMLIDLGPGPSGFRTYGIDATEYAGMEAEVRFTIDPIGEFPFGTVTLDNIRFSNVPLVPEPQTWALLGVGLAALRWWSRQR